MPQVLRKSQPFARPLHNRSLLLRGVNKMVPKQISQSIACACYYNIPRCEVKAKKAQNILFAVFKFFWQTSK
jgi:hypothetical protein